jgi:hypothetical protein
METDLGADLREAEKMLIEPPFSEGEARRSKV